MKFNGVMVKSVKADVAKGEITLSFTLPLEQLEKAEELARYVDVGDAGEVVLEVSPRQPALLKEGGRHA